MKRLLVVAIACIPLGFAPGLRADPTPNSGALQLGNHQIGTESMVLHDSEQMTRVTHQVNHDEPNPEQSATPGADESRANQFRLPEGMIIRSSAFGGVTVGVELPQ